MRSNLESDLRSRYSHMISSLRSDPINYCGIQCDDGWYHIIDDLLSRISFIKAVRNVMVRQIKEKFGLLRVYCSVDAEQSVRNQILKIIRDFEDLSGTVCEICGKQSTVVTASNGRLQSLCREHLNGDLP